MRASEILPGCTSRSSVNADGGFQADNAERAFFELLHLFAARVRRVIGGDDVDGAVRRCPCVTAPTSQCERSGGFIL